jgi:hypothetical protein
MKQVFLYNETDSILFKRMESILFAANYEEYKSSN